MLIYSKVRIGVAPDINALATIVIVVVFIGLLLAHLIARLSSARSG